MTPSDLQKMRELCERATPGPWHVGHINENVDLMDVDDAEGLSVSENELPGNASFICAARDFVPKAIDTIEAQQKEIERLSALVKHLQSSFDLVCKKFEEQDE